MQLPHQKAPENGPEEIGIQPIEQEHRCVPLDHAQQLARMGIAADHLRKLQIKFVERCKAQKQQLQRCVKAAVDRFIKVKEQFTLNGVQNIFAVCSAVLQLAAENTHGNWIALQITLDRAHLTGADRNALRFQHPLRGLTVKIQRAYIYGTQNPRELERHQPAGDGSASKQDKV
ncbi:hypothetical protein SDC9_93983 [bioreactor metagenome]|uniref:Uncharacterized protein n=1 Tax=bioreactor metagenome TaxID=1076179 RepID=A0A645A262_9ZZZZ